MTTEHVIGLGVETAAAVDFASSALRFVPVVAEDEESDLPPEEETAAGALNSAESVASEEDVDGSAVEGVEPVVDDDAVEDAADDEAVDAAAARFLFKLLNGSENIGPTLLLVNFFFASFNIFAICSTSCEPNC